MNNALEKVERGRMAADFLSQSITALTFSGLVEYDSSGANRVDRLVIQLQQLHADLSNIVDTARQQAKQQ